MRCRVEEIYNLLLLLFTMLLYKKMSYKSKNAHRSMQNFAQSFAGMKLCCKTDVVKKV